MPAAHAWGPDGHKIVGELAEQALTPAVHAQIQDLLKDEPAPPLAGVANWADTIRSEENWRFTGPWHHPNLHDLGCNYQPARHCTARKSAVKGRSESVHVDIGGVRLSQKNKQTRKLTH